MVPPRNLWRDGVRIRAKFAPFLMVLALIAAGCGSSDPVGTDPDPDVQPFVGTWEAVIFDVTNQANEAQVFRVVDAGFFTLNVQPSGFYTATLKVQDFPAQVENGHLAVIGNSVRLSPTGGQAATSSYLFEGPDRVELVGPTEFDFNFDGEAEAATAQIVLERS